MAKGTAVPFRLSDADRIRLKILAASQNRSQSNWLENIIRSEWMRLRQQVPALPAVPKEGDFDPEIQEFWGEFVPDSLDDTPQG